MTEPRIPPRTVRDYLQGKGWTLLESQLERGRYVLDAPDGEHQIVLPLDESVPDYARSLRLAVDTLAEVDGRPPPEQWSILATADEDVISLRMTSEDDPDAAIPLAYAAEALSGAQQLLQAAACAAVAPRIHYPRLDRGEARRLLEVARFRHTEAGSFVLNVSCPVHADVGPTKTEDSEVPFVRRVSRVLVVAAQRLVASIESGRVQKLIEEVRASARPVLSTNFCDALVRFAEGDRRSVELDVRWAPVLREPGGEVARIRFRHDYFRAIEDVRAGLRTTDEGSAETFVGTVESLNGDMGDDGRRSGEVVLWLTTDGSTTYRARVSLNADQYADADRAHMTHGAFVRVVGRLLPGRQPRALDGSRSFEVLPPAAE